MMGDDTLSILVGVFCFMVGVALGVAVGISIGKNETNQTIVVGNGGAAQGMVVYVWEAGDWHRYAGFILGYSKNNFDGIYYLRENMPIPQENDNLFVSWVWDYFDPYRPASELNQYWNIDMFVENYMVKEKHRVEK